MFEHIIHSWVGYELVKVLLKYGLNPSIRSDLEEWSSDLNELFVYFGEKTRDPLKKPNDQINTLFEKTEHCSYFGKYGLGKKTRFEKMANTIIPLVILTWLRQLQEHFFLKTDHSKQADWSDLGRYISQPANKQVNKGMNHVHLTSVTKVVHRMKSFHDIEPKKKGKGANKVVRSLLEWADMILCRDNNYVDEIVAQSLQKQGDTTSRKKYSMQQKNYSKQAVRGEGKQDDEIEEFTPDTMKRKSKEELLTDVGNFMIAEVAKLSKPKKRNIESTNRVNRVVACLVQYVNKVENKAFKSIKEMKDHMAESAKNRQATDLGESSSESSGEGSESEDDD